MDFIANNNLVLVNNDPAKNFQRKLRNLINECHITICKEEKWKYINLNPLAPTIRGLMKIHKIDSPMRPVVKWQNAPGYKLAEMLAKNLQLYLPLPYAFNVKNLVQLIDNLLNIPFDPNLQFVSFDIINMYSNVPTDDLVNINETLCKNHGINDKLKYELINISNTIMKQNYFQFLNTFYLQEKGLAMLSPTSSIFSKIYLQYIENTAIYDILRHNNIAGYFRYVDILIVYNNTTTNVIGVFNSFNEAMPT
jgi:hypothetical protein